MSFVLPRRLLAVLVTLTALAGCSGEGGSKKNSESNVPPAALPAQFDEDTGALEGLVVTVDELPIPGAGLFLEPGGLRTTAAEDGSYTFSRLAPGLHALLMGAAGFEPATLSGVSVVAGQATRLDIHLEEVLVLVPQQEALQKFSGYMQCRMSTTPLPVIGGTSGPCGFLPVVGTTLLDTVNPWTNDKNRNNFNVTTEDWQDIVFETTWTPTSVATNPKMQIIFSYASRTTGHTYMRSTENESYIKMVYARGGEHPGESLPQGQPTEPSMNDTQTAFMIVPFGSITMNNLHPANLALDQRYEMYITVFYSQAAPPDYTALPV